MEKKLTVFLCAAGILAVAYGVYRDNDVVFIIGLLSVAGGYLRVRKKLKESVRGESKKE